MGFKFPLRQSLLLKELSDPRKERGEAVKKQPRLNKSYCAAGLPRVVTEILGNNSEHKGAGQIIKSSGL